MLKALLYNEQVNHFLRSLLKPFVPLLPKALRFPVTGVFLVKGRGVPPFRMKTNATSAVTKYLFWGNVEGFEYSSVKVFMHLVRQSQVFFDIGANIGYYSLLGASLNKNVEIHAFEPMPEIYNYLEKNIQLNGFTGIRPVKLALSDTAGSTSFYAIRNSKFPDLPQLTGDGSLNNAHSANVNKIAVTVATETLDHYCALHLQNKKIDLIKLDTEAHEHFVLRGAEKVLSVQRPIIQCEILKGRVEEEIQEIMDRYDYLYFLATHKGLIPVKRFSGNTLEFMDYYLVPREKLNLVQSFVSK